MREGELRQVLLVRAVEESDAEGALIAVADRVAASREAKRGAGASGAPQDALLAARAQVLLRRITARHPFVETVLALAGGPGWLRWLLIALSLVAGFGLSALDGAQRIDILSFPLFGLVLWNLAAYAALAVAAVRSRARDGRKRSWLAGALAHAGLARASRMVDRSRGFDAPLAAALGRFVREWYDAAGPLLVLRAKRVLHLSAAAVGIGLVAGLYLRGLAFDYRAGWDSTFLDASQVRAVLAVVYQPALALTGISLPDAASLETIRWSRGGGENAARWMHLLAATAAVFVIAPRLLLALVATISIARLSRRVPLPSDLAAYSRKVFGASERALARVVPYAYEPRPNALARLRTLLAEDGALLAIDVQPVVPYGEEDAALGRLLEPEAAPPDSLVILMSLAATPEDENHGTLIVQARDRLAAESPGTHLLVVVDEGPYAARMGSKGGAPGRMDERRSLWREFACARGVTARFADLSA